MNTEQIKERIKLNSDLFKILVAFDLLGISAIATRTITNGADLTASVGYICFDFFGFAFRVLQIYTNPNTQNKMIVDYNTSIWLIFGLLMLIPTALSIHIYKGFKELKDYDKQEL